MTEIFVKICWQLKTPTRTWKCTRCIMQMSYLYASDFPFKNFCKLAQHAETIWKRLGKQQWRVLVVNKSTDNDKPHCNLFFTTISTPKNFFFRARAEKGIGRHIEGIDGGMDSCRQLPSNFWLFRSEHAHASYPGLSFRPPGFSPYMGREERKFRDWTNGLPC